MTINQRYSLDIFLGLTHYFNEDSSKDIELTIKNTYIQFAQKLVLLLNPSGTEIQNYEKMNQFFQAMCLTIDGENTLISNNPGTEAIIESVLDLLLKASIPNKIIKSFVLENPNRDSFWLKLLRSSGKFTNFLHKDYYFSIKNEIQILYQKVRSGVASVNDFIQINKQNGLMRDSMINYFVLVSGDRYDQIEEVITKHLCQLKSNLHIISNLDSFFGLYVNKIDIADESNKYLANLKKQFNTTELTKFEIRPDLLSIITDVENVNKWVSTIMFRNIFHYLNTINLFNKLSG
jgi:hypothetical protein